MNFQVAIGISGRVPPICSRNCCVNLTEFREPVQDQSFCNLRIFCIYYKDCFINMIIGDESLINYLYSGQKQKAHCPYVISSILKKHFIAVIQDQGNYPRLQQMMVLAETGLKCNFDFSSLVLHRFLLPTAALCCASVPSCRLSGSTRSKSCGHQPWCPKCAHRLRLHEILPNSAQQTDKRLCFQYQHNGLKRLQVIETRAFDKVDNAWVTAKTPVNIYFVHQLNFN